MERRYYNEHITIIWFAIKNSLRDFMLNAIIIMVTIVALLSNHMFLVEQAKASPSFGLQLFMHVIGSGNTTGSVREQDPSAKSLQSEQKSHSTHLVLYTSPDDDFKFWYPSDWSVNEGNITNSGVVISSPDMGGKILVSAMNLSPTEAKMTTSELAKSVLLSQNDSRSRLIELNPSNYFLSGYSALKIVQVRTTDVGLDDYTASGEYKSMSLIALVQGKAYFVSYIAEPEKYPNYLQTAQTVIDSFEIASK